VATDRFRAILRHPQDALSIAHVGGLSLLDLSVWPDGADRLHEAVPLVGGGWLDIAEWSLEDDAITVAGTVVSLPDQPAPSEGRWAEVRWRFDGSTIEAEGADGFYIHPRGAVERDGEAFAMPDMVLRDGGATVDLGGAIRTDSPSFRVDTPSEAWALDEPLVEVRTDAPVLELQRDGVVVGRAPVDRDLGTTWIEAVDAVRAVQSGRAPGPWVPLTPVGVDAPRGDEGSLEIVLADRRGAILDWSSDDGRSGERILGPGGGTLATGPGIYDLQLRADPLREAWSATVEVLPGDVVEVEAPWRGGGRDEWALVQIGAPSDRNRSWRGTNGDAVRRVHAMGADVAAFLVEDDTVDIDPWEDARSELRAHGGLLRRGVGPDGPWRIAAWPVPENARKNAHGALGAATDDPVEAFASAWGGTNEIRHVQVDVATLDMLGPAHTLPALPDLVHLEAPDDDLDNWSPWLDRLEEGRSLTPTAEHTWVPVGDRAALAIAEVDQALFAGPVCAGSGPLVVLDRTRQTLVASRLDADTGTVELWTDQGLVHRAEGPVARSFPPQDARWAIAVVRDREAWAVTGPIWLVDPATGEPVAPEPPSPGRPGLR